MAHCYTCGGNGMADGCPECEKVEGKLNLGKIPEATAGKIITRSRTLDIPEEYVGSEWSIEEFVRSKHGIDLEKNFKLKKFLHDLRDLHDDFANGLLPAKGAFIIAPGTYGKERFAYSCMQHAIKNGFRVAPLLGTSEVKRLLVLSSENVHYKLHKKIDYDDYITSDVVFISVTNTDYYRGTFMVIEELLAQRSRMGLPTYIISRRTIEEISEWDKTGDFRKLSTPWRTDNLKKYPKIIMYREVVNFESEGNKRYGVPYAPRGT